MQTPSEVSAAGAAKALAALPRRLVLRRVLRVIRKVYWNPATPDRFLLGHRQRRPGARHSAHADHHQLGPQRRREGYHEVDLQNSHRPAWNADVAGRRIHAPY